MAIGYGRIREQLEAAFQLCQSFGLDARRSRFGEYARRLDRLIAVVKDREAGRATESVEAVLAKEQVSYMLALTESTEFGDIMETLAGSDPVGLKAKLEDVLRGPLLPVDEDPSSGNKSRNTLFELSLAAKLKHAGYEPELGEHPDLRVTVDDRVIGFECKRPFVEHSIPDNLRKAEKQLIRDLKDHRNVPAGARGIVAISLSKTMNPGDLLYTYSNEQAGRNGLEHELARQADQYRPIYGRFRHRIVAVIFHVITPSLNRSANRYDVGQQLYMDLLTSPGSQADARAVQLATSLSKTVD